MNELGDLPPWWAVVLFLAVVVALVLWGDNLPLPGPPSGDECWAPGRGPTPC